MIDREMLEGRLAEFPLYAYFFVKPEQFEFSTRIRWICENECPRYGRTWACPPGVGTLEHCSKKCLSYSNCLVIGTVAEAVHIGDMEEALATRPAHEAITNEVASLFREQGIEPYILSTDSCAFCDRCAILDGKPCRMPEKMHPCLESHGINVIPVLEENGLEFQYGADVITWYSLLFFND